MYRITGSPRSASDGECKGRVASVSTSVRRARKHHPTGSTYTPRQDTAPTAPTAAGSSQLPPDACQVRSRTYSYLRNRRTVLLSYQPFVIRTAAPKDAHTRYGHLSTNCYRSQSVHSYFSGAERRTVLIDFKVSFFFTPDMLESVDTLDPSHRPPPNTRTSEYLLLHCYRWKFINPANCGKRVLSNHSLWPGYQQPQAARPHHHQKDEVVARQVLKWTEETYICQTWTGRYQYTIYNMGYVRNQSFSI